MAYTAKIQFYRDHCGDCGSTIILERFTEPNMEVVIRTQDGEHMIQGLGYCPKCKRVMAHETDNICQACINQSKRKLSSAGKSDDKKVSEREKKMLKDIKKIVDENTDIEVAMSRTGRRE